MRRVKAAVAASVGAVAASTDRARLIAMRAWLGLGSNLDDPLTQLQRAVEALRRLPGTRVTACSPVYRNPALRLPGQPPQPDYCNAVVAIDTDFAPLPLLDALQAIETAQGRVREQRWGARTLDLDLLLYGNDVIDHPRLQVPHPAMRERRFVLQPLADIDPGLQLPDGCTVSEWLARCPPSPLTVAGRLA